MLRIKFWICSKQSKEQANAESKAIPRIKLLVTAMSNNENEASNNESRIIDNRKDNKQFQETALIQNIYIEEIHSKK